MARKPPIVKLHELQPGQPPADCFALLVEKLKTTTRDGRMLIKCRFKDSRRTAEAAIWPDSVLYEDCDQHWTPGTVYKLRCTYAEHERYGPKLDIVQIREAVEADEADGLSLDDFLDRPRVPPEELFAALRELADAELSDEPLKSLVLALLDANRETLLVLPASPRQFYPFPGGWLEHVLAVARNCLWLAGRYRERFPDMMFNRDLVLAGAILHDIGRVRELVPSPFGQPAEATVEGRLLGHIALGRDMIRAAAADIADLNPELSLLLEHLVMVHLTLPEWGSPRLPMIPEALILHHADDLDAKFEMYARHLLRDSSPGPFTERDPVLGKPLLKRRSV